MGVLSHGRAAHSPAGLGGAAAGQLCGAGSGGSARSDEFGPATGSLGFGCCPRVKDAVDIDSITGRALTGPSQVRSQAVG